MLSTKEIRAALTGFLLLLRFDSRFADWFDRSPAGARRSFRLMLPLLPLTLTRLFIAVDVAPDANPVIVATSIATYYVLGWIVFPLLLILIGRMIAKESEAKSALSAYNWLGFSFSVMAFLLTLIGLHEPLRQIAEFLLTFLILASLIYEAYLLNTLTRIGYFGAALLAGVDYIIANGLLFLLLIEPNIIVPST